MKMNNFTLIIPSAKIIPEPLQNIGKLPAVIYPVSQRIIFDYLYEQYAEISGKIKVICYENSEDVSRKLSHYGEKVKIHVLDKLEDLGYTVYAGLEGEKNPVIINFADTLITENIYEHEQDCFYYSEDYFSETWTFFEIENGTLTKIIDKKPGSSTQNGKLFTGVFKINEPEKFRSCLENAIAKPSCEINTFYQALKDYSIIRPLKALKTESWFDIGHIDKYFGSRLEVSAREFNYIKIDRAKGILHKTSDDKEKFIREIKWYLKLPAELEYVHPRIFDYSLHYTNPNVSMEYYAYHTLHELFVYGDLNFHQWSEIFRRIYSVCEDFGRYTVKGEKILPALEEIYLVKTLERLDSMKKNFKFSAFFTNDIYVNGKKYPSLNDLREILRKFIPKILYNVDSFSIIHGDLCFTNIMTAPDMSFIKLIDPRGSFGAYDIYGDPDYDLAKILHSIEGKYDFIIKNLFTSDFNLDTASIKYEIFAGKYNFDMSKLFQEIFSPNMRRIKLIEALLFLSMIPLHNESTAQQVIMLGTGLEILDEIINIAKK